MNATTDTQTLILSGAGYNLTIAPEAEAQKAELIKHSALIVEVRDAGSSDVARNHIKKLAAMRNLTEKSRKAVKEPVLKVSRIIDDKAADFVGAIIAEEKRLSALVADFAAEVERERQRIAREMQAKREAEEKALREAEAARLKAEQEAEAARRKAAAAEWEDDDAAAKATAEAAAKAQAAADEAARAAAAARVAPLVELAPAKASGVRFELDFEVTNLPLLYAVRPELVKLEVRRAETLAWLKGLNADAPDLEAKCAEQGLKVFKKPVVGTR